MLDAWLLLVVQALPFAGSVAAAFLPTRARNSAAVIAGSVSVCALAIIAFLYPRLPDDGAIRLVLTWLPTLGIDFTLRLNGLSWLFSILVLGIGALVVLYARYYMSSEDPVPRFFSFLLAFMGAMTGVVLSGNLIQIIFFWEMTSIFSFLLIGYWHHNQAARDGARMALVVTAAGGVCLLVGFLLLGRIAGSYDLDRVLAEGAVIQASPIYLPMLVMILLGAFTKSAQVPFHFWLPQAMAAPTPVSAYLHSATMVKAGIFILTLFWPVLSGTDAWFFLVTGAGVLTLLVGAWSAIFKHDLKGLLAYSTISHLGLITLLLGLGSPLAAVAAIFHTANHATFKASLFMAAGIIDHETGTRDLRRLSGLYRFMPITATLAMVAAAAMAGVPLLNGFLSKEMFLAEVLESHSDTLLDRSLPVLATVASAFSVLYSLRFIHQTFFGPPPVDLPRVPHEPPSWMRRPVEILVLICLLVGMLPAITMGPFLATAVQAVLGERTPVYSLAIWHGVNAPLLMSVIALVAGVALYVIFRDRLSTVTHSPLIGHLKARRTFDLVMEALSDGARWLEGRLGTRRLQVQLRLLVGTALVAAALPVIRFGYMRGPMPETLIDPVFGVTWVIGGAAAIAAAWQAKYHRLVAVVLVGVSGLATCISFVWLSAPDLAVTQLLVEVVTVTLLLLALRWLPKRLPDVWTDTRKPLSVIVRRVLDLTVAVLAGGGATALAYAMMTRPMPNTISRAFIERSYPEAGGTNVVNVLLVDFRGFDTLGEITVLAIVAITVFSLLRRFRPAPESVEAPELQQIQNAYDEAAENRKPGDTLSDYLRLPRLTSELLFPVIITFAVYLLMRGHDLPGGGFAAGVTMSIALILQYMVSGTRSIEERLYVQPLRWMGGGLLLAAFTGLAAWGFGYPFLKTYFRYVDLPVFGKVPVASALLFDIGVFALVVGATVLMLIAIAHQSIRAPYLSRKGRAAQARTEEDA